MREKKLLLLGGSHAEIPLILAAQKLGWYVITTGNNPSGLGHPYANKNIFADFSDKDAMLKLAIQEKVEAICSGCNDFALLSTTYICEQLNLPGHDSFATSLNLHHKDKYRSLANELKIPTPKSTIIDKNQTFEETFSKLKFPIIIKPIDLTGGKGICKINSIDKAMEAYQKAFLLTRQNHILAEEFIEGSHHGFSAMILNGRVVFSFVDNEQYFINKYMVSGANSPTESSKQTINVLKQYSEQIAQNLNLVDGILHIQYIENTKGIPYIIEICRRAPGDLYIKLVQYATGIDYAKYIVMAETGEDISSIKNIEPQGFWLRHCIMPNNEIKNGDKIQDIYFDKSIQKNIVEKFLWFKSNDTITDKLTYKAGIVFLKFNSLLEMQEKTKEMTNLIKIVKSNHT